MFGVDWVILLFSVFAIFILLILSVFVLILYLLLKIPRFGKAISISLVLFGIYTIYTAIYPPESFYKDEFELNMGFPLSNSISFIKKQASYPDFHGDYYSTATIEISEKDYKKILHKISISTNNNCKVSKHMRKNNLEPLSCLSIEKEQDKHFELIMFSDKKTIYFLYSQT